MPFVEARGARFWVEEVGDGPPLVCLHSGWGRGVMPFDHATRELASRYRMIFPDRRGYGRSTPLERLPLDFHQQAAHDLRAVVAALGIERPILWGHSDGAVIAALHAADHPTSVRALVLEAIHFHRAKSKDFFARYAKAPESLPATSRERLAADHGERWPTVVRMHSEVWLAFHDVGGDFYGDRLSAITCPTLVLHGESDVHTPVAEVEEVVRRIPGAELAVVAGGGHCPHAEPAVASVATALVAAFLDAL